MSMNKYIHPRNRYKNPPDFTQLAVEYPDFRNIGTLDITGRFKIDFQNVNTLPVLTKCLLDKDFGLKVDFPPDKLVPTLALRLNYIHWLEDIFQIALKRADRLIGIDIGCGASCIYPLLAAKLNQWQFYALETNLESCKYAEKNILNNNLDSLITVIPQSNVNTIFHDLVMKESTTFKEADFCMCNPPFFNKPTTIESSAFSDQEIPRILNKKQRNRTGKRALPKNAKFGCDAELYVEGGECNFVEKIILESCQLKTNIQVYTTMLGHKSSVKIVLNSLRTKGITNICQTEFCQGHTTRWGIGWSFNPDILLELVPSFGPTPNNDQHQLTTKKKSFTFDVPPLDVGNDISLLNVFDKLKQILNEINLKLEKFNQIDDTVIKCELLATENTWSNQRRKRREMKQKICLNDDVCHTGADDIESFYDSTNEMKKIKLDNEMLIYLRTGIYILKHPADGIVIRLEYLDGTAKNDGVYQILQFLRNHWK